MTNFPKSKIVQVVALKTIGDKFFGTVLCEDGSIWQRTERYQDWECILDLQNHQEEE